MRKIMTIFRCHFGHPMVVPGTRVKVAKVIQNGLFSVNFEFYDITFVSV